MIYDRGHLGFARKPPAGHLCGAGTGGKGAGMADGFRIGVDLGGTKIEAALLDRAGAVRDRRRIPTPRDDYEATVRAVAGLVAAVERGAGNRATVGIGTP